MTTTVTAAEFNREPSRVKRAAAEEPVVITEHSRPSYVLISYAEYQRLTGAPPELGTWLVMEDDVEFEIPAWGVEIRSAEL